MHPTDRSEQLEMRSAHSLLVGDPVDDRSARVAALVHRVPETWHEPAGSTRLEDDITRECVPRRVITGQVALAAVDRPGEEPSCVLGHPEEARAAAEEPGGERTLQ